MPARSHNLLYVKQASSRLHKLVLDWLAREADDEGLTTLEAVYCLQQAQNRLINMRIQADNED